MKGLRGDSLMLALVMLVFIAVALWLFQRTRTEDKPNYAPLTTFSAQPDGAQALFELLEQTGQSPKRYTGTEYHYPEGSCMVILEAGTVARLSTSLLDVKALRLWIERGGCLVLGSDSTPKVAEELFEELQIGEPTVSERGWINRAGTQATAEKVGISGKLTPLTRIEKQGEIHKLPAKQVALFSKVDRIEIGDGAEQLIAAVPLLRTDSPILWHRGVGKGDLYWLTRPEMASNAWIARADNHRLLLNVLDAAAHDRQLYFDEHIHGYLRETPNLMVLLTRTHGGHMLLGLIALTVLLFAGAAVRPARFFIEHVPVRRQGVEMVLAQADLYQRADARHVIADCQIDRLRRVLMDRRHVAFAPSDSQIAEWIEQEWSGDSKHRQLLTAYLSNRLLGRGHNSLLDLSRACDNALAMLS
ncbi:MAG: DUF4350 domain-containing protein [bacterium]|nr:DUF4350 domain-containing protein [bacterium]